MGEIDEQIILSPLNRFLKRIDYQSLVILYYSILCIFFSHNNLLEMGSEPPKPVEPEKTLKGRYIIRKNK